MTHNRFLLWAAATLLILTTACTETDMLKADMPQEPSKQHTYRLSIDMPVPSHDGQATRANTEWEDGSQVEFKFYISGTNVTYNTVSGLATYSSAKREWSLVPEGDFPSDRTMTDCEVRYYQSPVGSTNNFLTAVYFGTTTYSIDGNLIQCNSISLKPTNWRLRFQGERDAQIQLSSPDLVHRLGGMVDEDYYLSDGMLTLTVSSDGYTPYIYGTFKNETGDNSITIETGGQKYIRTISGNVLKPGETGYIVIPTESNYEAEGWTKESTAVEIEAVDLGLPSGVKWANMNVGANRPEEYGDYFAWGETEPKSKYSWSTYKWMTDGQSSWQWVNKYQVADGQEEGCWYNSDGEFIGDNKTKLEADDDAATANWGCDWCMPTPEEQKELIDECTWTWTTLNGVDGYCVTGSNGNSIFLPFAGYRSGSNIAFEGTLGCYWSSSLHNSGSSSARRFRFDSNNIVSTSIDRYTGQSVRPVQTPSGTINEDTNCLSFTVTGNGKTATFKMILVEGGTFQMGATNEQGSDADDDEKPVHQVTVSSFSIGQTEVTQALWYAVMGQKPTSGGSQWSSTYGLGDNRPAYYVSWNDCQEFISKLNQITGQQFRLPTEAEWEFAARGGTKSKGYKYSGSNTVGDVAWYWDNIPSHTSGNSGYGTQPVATKQANELGIYDMSGNVWEWCSDWYGSYTSDAQTNPTGSTLGSNRVRRGGGWYNGAGACRVAIRDYYAPTYRNYNLGLRLAL